MRSDSLQRMRVKSIENHAGRLLNSLGIHDLDSAYDGAVDIEILTHPQRLPHTNRPTVSSSLEAKFSVQYCVARALMHGRYHVSVGDIRSLAHPTLRHRIVTNFFAESEGVDVETVVARLLETVPEPTSGM